MNKKPGAIVLEGHVQGLSNTRSLGELGIPVYVLDVVHCLAEHSKYCSRFFLCPPFGSEEFIWFLMDIAKSERLEGWLLVPSNDHIVENLSLHRKELSDYYKMLVPENGMLQNIVNKRNLLSLAKSCNVPIPQTCYFDGLRDVRELRFPVLVKGNKGLDFYKSTHVKAIQANTYNELMSTISGLERIKEDVMIQEMIPYDNLSRAVSFTCFAVEGEIKSFWMGQKIREHPILFGTATMSESVRVDSILPNARVLVNALHYTGTCEIEFMYDSRDQQYKLIEINPRTWLWVGLAKECGVDYAKIMYRFVNDQTQSYPDGYMVGVKWRNSITDSYYGAVALLKKQVSLNGFTKSLRGRIVHAVWSSKDVLPGVVFPFMLWSIAKHRR